MKILAIETSCDETAAAVLGDGLRVLSNPIASQVDIHARLGGIVPEVASRQHMIQIVPIIQEALDQSATDWDKIDAVAVTAGPGLAGSLLVGVNMAKAIALARDVPLIGINHVEAHIYANWIAPDGDAPSPPSFPLVALIASGGHTDLVLARGHGDYDVLGRTRDDAAGEAFDKVARILGLGYPGGPIIQRVSQEAVAPASMPRPWLKGSGDFSFSGLKTALLQAAQKAGLYPRDEDSRTDEERRELVANLAAGFQESVVDVLVEKTVSAANAAKANHVVLAGGVAANGPLRQRLVERAGIPVSIPPPVLCTDNAAMIAACAHYRLAQGETSNLDLDVFPGWKIGEIPSRRRKLSAKANVRG